MSGKGSRSADLGPPHGNRVARRAKGLEAAVVDKVVGDITSLDGADSRSFEVAIAGPAALLVAKLHKIADRADRSPAQAKNKDALDVLRLLGHCSSEALAGTLRVLAADRRSDTVTQEAIAKLGELFGTERATGTEMAVRATEPLRMRTPSDSPASP